MPAWLSWPEVFIVWTTLLKFAVVALGFVMPLSALLTLLERRQSAYIQDRLGPTRAHFLKIGKRRVTLGGLIHVPADALKMLFKEPFAPKLADGFLFWLAPALGFVSSLVIVAFIPFGPDLSISMPAPLDIMPLQLVRVDGGLLWIFALGSLGIYGTALAGYSSNNKFALLGGLRATAQSISYEIALGLTLVGMLIVAGETELSRIVTAQTGPLLWGWLPRWGLFAQPLGALLFLTAAMAETKRAPFDLPEGESEIIGYFLEYSSMAFGLFMLGEFVEVVVLAALFTTLFLGGWSVPWMAADGSVSLGLFDVSAGTWGYALLGMAVFAFKTFFMCLFQLQVRWSMVRFRYDQLMDVGWKMLLPLALVNIVVTTGLILIDPSAQLLTLVGLISIGMFALIVIGGPTKVSPAPKPAAHTPEVAHGH